MPGSSGLGLSVFVVKMGIQRIDLTFLAAAITDVTMRWLAFWDVCLFWRILVEGHWNSLRGRHLLLVKFPLFLPQFQDSRRPFLLSLSSIHIDCFASLFYGGIVRGGSSFDWRLSVDVFVGLTSPWYLGR